MPLESNSCQQCQEALLNFSMEHASFRELPVSMSTHLETCMECRKYRDGLERITTGGKKTVLYTPGLRYRTLKKIVEHRETSPLSKWFWITGSVSLGLVFSYWLPFWLLTRLISYWIPSYAVAASTAFLVSTLSGILCVGIASLLLLGKKRGEFQLTFLTLKEDRHV